MAKKSIVSAAVCLAVASLALLTSASLVAAADWQARPGGSYKSPGQGPKSKGRNTLPDGHVATASKGDIAKAWYIQPTSRYRHAILGDAIEASGLKVELHDGRTLDLNLPKNRVFEDRTPRLMDLDGDGAHEIITLLSSNSGGAAIAVYGVANGKLTLIDQTPFIGLSNRWRNIAGIADYNGDGALEIAEVVTPHIGGTLRFWSWRGKRLSQAAAAKYFSNHAIGAREQRLSATADFNGDGRPDLAVPGRSRQTLHLMGFIGPNRKLQTIDSVELRADIAGAIVANTHNGKPVMKVQLRDGSVWDIRDFQK
ncbi:MAG: VCBS repeat-containing protein [Rhizobiaceae bacterium]